MTVKKLTQAQAAYIAGILDGEGSLTIIRRPEPNYKSGFAYFACVTIGNTSTKLLSWITRTTGLGKTAMTRRATSTTKAAWQWRLRRKEIVPFLRRVQDHLVIKRPQADLLINFIHIKRHRGGGSYLTSQETRKQIATYERIKFMNRRGDPDQIARARGKAMSG